MVRIIGFLVGLGFVAILFISLIVDAATYFRSPPEESAEYAFHVKPRSGDFSFASPVGTYDKAQLQRGLKVFTEVCAGCHGLTRVAFRDLQAIGYSEGQAKNFATEQWKIEVPTINPETGEAATRKPTLADKFPSPYANETAARLANNNAYPPDLSLMAKARPDGANYIYSLLTGYRDAATYKNAEGEPVPEANRPGPGLHFNPYFANLNIAMPPPLLNDGQVSYDEGAPKATIDQMAKDVSAFLMWTAEPKLENRHRAGLAVLIFLIVGTILGYLAYQNVWAGAKRKVAPKGPLDPENQAKRTRARKAAGVKG